MAQQKLEQQILPFSEPQRTAVVRVRTRVVADCDTALGKCRSAYAFSSFEKNADAQKQFGRGEWFGEIVVGTTLQPCNTVADLSETGKKEDSALRGVLPDLGEKLQAVSVRKHAVENNAVELLPLDIGARGSDRPRRRKC